MSQHSVSAQQLGLYLQQTGEVFPDVNFVQRGASHLPTFEGTVTFRGQKYGPITGTTKKAVTNALKHEVYSALFAREEPEKLTPPEVLHLPRPTIFANKASASFAPQRSTNPSSFSLSPERRDQFLTALNGQAKFVFVDLDANRMTCIQELWTLLENHADLSTINRKNLQNSANLTVFCYTSQQRWAERLKAWQEGAEWATERAAWAKTQSTLSTAYADLSEEKKHLALFADILELCRLAHDNAKEPIIYLLGHTKAATNPEGTFEDIDSNDTKHKAMRYYWSLMFRSFLEELLPAQLSKSRIEQIFVL